MIEANRLKLALVADPQLGFTAAHNRTSKTSLPPGTGYNEAEIDKKYYQLAMKSINAIKPEADAVIILGDMVNDPADENEWQDYKAITDGFKAPVYEVMGNHDGFSRAGLEYYRNTLKKQDYYSFRLKDVFFLVLNSNHLKEPGLLPDEEEHQKEFAEEELAANSSTRYKIILLHHPLYFKDADAEETYFSLPLTPRKWLLGLAEKYGIMAVLAGHYHGNYVVRYKETEIITSGAVSKPLHTDNEGEMAGRGYRIIDLDCETGSLTHNYYEIYL